CCVSELCAVDIRREQAHFDLGSLGLAVETKAALYISPECRGIRNVKDRQSVLYLGGGRDIAQLDRAGGRLCRRQAQIEIEPVSEVGIYLVGHVATGRRHWRERRTERSQVERFESQGAGNNREGIREGKFERTHAWVLVHRELGSAELYPPGLAGYLADERNRTDSTTGSRTGPEPLQNPAQRRRGKLRLAIEKGILGETGVAFEGECGGRRLECDGEARGSASEQKERRGNRKIN